MGKKKSKRHSKKVKSKKNRAADSQSNLSKEQQNLQKSSFDEIAEIFIGNNPEKEQNKYANINSTKSISQASNTNDNKSTAEATNVNSSENTSEGNKTNDTKCTSGDTDNTDESCEQAKAKQQELLSNLKNLSDSVAAITATRDNVASLRIEILTSIYFTREVRPLIDAMNLIAFSSVNMTTAALNLQANTFGDKKELKKALKLCYKMNDEIEDVVDTLSRRIRLYTAQLNNMDRNCPPFDFDKDS